MDTKENGCHVSIYVIPDGVVIDSFRASLPESYFKPLQRAIDDAAKTGATGGQKLRDVQLTFEFEDI